MNHHTLSDKQQQFLDAVNEGKNVFLTGKAGTGKSHVVRIAINQMKAKRKNIVALAPTGIAAINIGGQTIHSMFSIYPFGVLSYESCNHVSSKRRRLFDAIDVILIDEVSMLRPDVLDAVNWTLIKNGCKPLSERQVIFIGDLKQLPSPMDDNTRSVLMTHYDGPEFSHAKIYRQINPEHIELDKVQRQSNQEFINNLNIIREGGRSEYFRSFVSTEPKGIILAPYNTVVSRYNVEGLNKKSGREYVFDADISGNAKMADFNFETQVKVKDGCKIMYLWNSKNNDLVNGTLGIFRVVDDKFFIEVNGVKYSLEPITVEKKEYVLNRQKNELELIEVGSITQMPIRLAFALTIHKSQGLTFDEVTVDLRMPCFQPGQLYTALSRVKSPEGLRIII